MDAFIEQVMALWQQPQPDEAAFATCYADKLTVNGEPMTLAGLVERARSLHASFSDFRHEVLDVVAAPERLAVAFVMHMRHTGPYPAPSGVLPATGRTVAVRTIDILTVRDHKITDITVVSDDLGLLKQLGAVG